MVAIAFAQAQGSKQIEFRHDGRLSSLRFSHCIHLSLAIITNVYFFKLNLYPNTILVQGNDEL
jgi:hypothetical protein